MPPNFKIAVIALLVANLLVTVYYNSVKRIMSWLSWEEQNNKVFYMVV
jgi:hypothetical protein